MTLGGPAVARIEIDGHNATAEQLRVMALAHYGHFTAMQVRNRRVRGLGLHFARLDAANREMFGSGLDEARVRGHIGHALGDDTRDASVRAMSSSCGRVPMTCFAPARPRARRMARP